MMKYAVTRNREIIYAHQLNQSPERHGNLYCPICHQRVIVKCSKRQKYFFSHLKSCQSSEKQPERRVVQESAMHHAGKEILKRALDLKNYSVKLEYYFAEINQRADVFVMERQTGWSSVLEFQYSKIPPEEIKRRTELYQTLVDQVVWFSCYETLKLDSQLNHTWHHTMTMYDANWGYYIPYLDLTDQTIGFIHSIPLIYQRNHYQLPRTIVNLATGNGKTKGHLTSQGRRSNKAYATVLIGIKRDPTYRRSLVQLYQRGMSLDHLPCWVLTDLWQCYFCLNPFWELVAWIQVYQSEDLSFDELVDCLLNHSVISWGTSAFIERERIVKETLHEVLDLLSKNHH